MDVIIFIIKTGDPELLRVAMSLAKVISMGHETEVLSELLLL